MAGERLGQVDPGHRFDAEEGLDLCGHARQHRLEVGHQHPEQVQADAAHVLHGLPHALLPGQRPGLLLVDVLVGAVGQGHDLAHGLAELALLVQPGDLLAGAHEGVVEVRFGAGLRQAAVEALADEAGAAAGDVDHLADQVGVHAQLEVIEVEVDVVDAGAQLGGEVIAQVFRIQMVQPGARLDEGAARLGHLLAVDGEEAVRMDGGGHAEAAAGQHGGPEQGVEIDDVLADEVVQLGRGIPLPVVIEVEAGAVAEIAEAGHVADGGVQPDVEILVLRARNPEAEVGRVARDVPFLQAVLEPFVELVGDLGLQMAGAGPLAQQGAEVGELEEVVQGFLFDGPDAGDGGHGILQLGRRVGRAAGLAGVAVLVGGAAARALALDEAVRQEHRLHRVVGLGDGAGGDVAGVAQTRVDQFGERAVLVGMGAVVVVEADQEVGEVGAVLGADALDELLRRDAFALGAQHDGRAVGIVGADVEALVAAQLLEAHPYIGLDVLDQMAQVDRSVGVGQGAGHQDAAGAGGAVGHVGAVSGRWNCHWSMFRCGGRGATVRKAGIMPQPAGSVPDSAGISPYFPTPSREDSPMGVVYNPRSVS